MDELETGTPAVGRSANDRFKDRWDNRVAWSTIYAAVFHAVVITFAGFHFVPPVMDSSTARGQMVLLPPSFAEGFGLEGRSTPVARPEEESPDVPSEPDGGMDGSEEGGAGDDATRDRWAATAARLGYGAQFRAEVVEMEDAGERDGERDGDPPSVKDLDSAEALAELSEGDSLAVDLDLDRLTEIRPELAVMIPSMWILLRNPTEVEDYLRRSYGRWSLDPDRPASVTVTVWIDTKGSVEWAEVSRSSGQTNLDEAALELFNEVVAFRPARHEGVSISGSATFALLFPW